VPDKFDERLYSGIRALSDVSSLCNNRVYHLEVIQNVGLPLSKYPCLVYEIESDASLPELNGRSGRREATFNWMCFSKSSADTRTLAKAIESITQNITQAENLGFDWFVVRDITDQYEIPFEYDEKATKSTVLSLYCLYPEDQ
jgi:hypothetical protein